MPPFIPSLLLILLWVGPALLTPSTSTELQVGGQRSPREAQQDSIKVSRVTVNLNLELVSFRGQ